MRNIKRNLTIKDCKYTLDGLSGTSVKVKFEFNIFSDKQFYYMVHGMKEFPVLLEKYKLVLTDSENIEFEVTGHSICGFNDVYSEKRGKDLALARAKYKANTRMLKFIKDLYMEVDKYIVDMSKMQFKFMTALNSLNNHMLNMTTDKL